MSHPTWVRGLKRRWTEDHVQQRQVAPYVGAWIETGFKFAKNVVNGVAPYVGAWIETYGTEKGKNLATKSHPTWVRGLKQNTLYHTNEPCSVAPYVGAWIETKGLAHAAGRAPSHPTWVRGLKHLVSDKIIHQRHVAPYVGAWIETCRAAERELCNGVAPYVGAWIETQCKDTEE